MVHLVLNYQLKFLPYLERSHAVSSAYNLSGHNSVLTIVGLCVIQEKNASICDSRLEITDTFQIGFLNFRGKYHIFGLYVCTLYLILYCFSPLLKGFVLTAKMPKGHGTFPFTQR